MNPLSVIRSELGGAATALSLLASLASSQHRNNVDSGLMPVYGELPATSVASLKALAAFSEGEEYEGEGPLRLSFNSSMREWQEMGKKSFFLLPAVPPGEGVGLSMKFLDNSAVQLWQLQGKPSSATTHAMLIGLTGDGLQPEGALMIGARVVFATPAAFLSAEEDLERVAVQKAAVWASKERSRTDDTQEAEDTGADESPEKRMRCSLQDSRGVQGQGEKKDSTVMIVDLEGGLHATRLKKNLAGREKELGVVFRVCAKERWPHIMGTECVLQVEEYARVIIEQCTFRHSERDDGFETCGLLDRIWNLNFSEDKLLLKKLLTGEFGGPSEDALDLQKFAGRSIKIPIEATPCPQQNRALVHALKNMELVLEVFYGPAFNGTTVFFIDKLEGLERPMELASSAFLLHSLEVVLSRYFRALRMATTEANTLVRDISSPTKCAAHLTTMLKDFISTVDTQEKLNEAMSRYRLHDYRGRIGAAAKGVATPLKKDKKEKAAGTVVPKPHCGENFAGQLKAQDPKTSRIFACQYGDACRYQHDDITGWTEAKKSATAANLAYRFRQPSLDALGKVKSGKTRV